jgi:hypothetical protein
VRIEVLSNVQSSIDLAVQERLALMTTDSTKQMPTEAIDFRIDTTELEVCTLSHERCDIILWDNESWAMA